MIRILDRRWERKSGLGALVACLLVAACDGPVSPDQLDVRCEGGQVRVAGQVVPTAPNGYATAGNRIVRADDCSVARFYGVSRPPLSLSAGGERLGIDTAAVADFTRMRAWGANTVRLELAQYYWVPTSRFYDPGYAARVERAVGHARAAGLNVILALQFSDRGDPNYPGDPRITNMHQPMPDVNHSVPFWRDVANRFKHDGGVLFELYSEPYPVGGSSGFANWELWRNGGTAPADDTYDPRAAFEAVGMQQLYKTVRDTGAHNLVLISGTHWGYLLDGIPGREIQGYNIAYATHPWDYVDPNTGVHHRPPERWDQDWAFLAAKHPVMITEFGGYDCTEPYVRAMLDKADALGLSWIAWAWVAPIEEGPHRQEGRGDPVCEYPMLILDWEGTPSKTGQIVKARLNSYRGS